MTPSRSRLRIEGIDLDLVYYALHMSIGKRVRERQPEMWVATTNCPTAASHSFYTLLNERLAEHYFDDFVEGQFGATALLGAAYAYLVVPESGAWQVHHLKHADRERGTIKQIFVAGYRRRTLIATLAAASGLTAYWGINTWLPTGWNAIRSAP